MDLVILIYAQHELQCLMHIKSLIKVCWMHEIIKDSIAYVFKVIVLIKVAPSLKMPLLPARFHLLWLIPQWKIPCSFTEVWIQGCMFGESEERAPAQLRVSLPPYFGSCNRLTSPSLSPTLSALSRHPASFPSLISDAKLAAGETSAPGCIFPVVLFCLYLHFMISHLEGKTERAIFSPLPCRGLSRFWAVWNDLARGWSPSQLLPISLCIRGAGWVKYFISCQQNPVLFRFHGRRKKEKIENVRNEGKVYVQGFFFFFLQSFKTLTHTFLTRDVHSWRIPLTSLHFSLIIDSSICIILFILHSGAASVSSSYSLKIPVNFVG